MLALSSRKLDDFAALSAFPLDNRISATDAADEKHVDRHGENKASNGDMHVAVDDFVIRDFSHPEGQARRHNVRLSDALETPELNSSFLNRKWRISADKVSAS